MEEVKTLKNNVFGQKHIKYVCLNGKNAYIHTLHTYIYIVVTAFFVSATRHANCTRYDKDYVHISKFTVNKT
jgi:hypothetical protein